MSDDDRPSIPDSDSSTDHEGLLEELALIEDQPLADRARAYQQVTDRLSAQLRASDES